MSFIIIYVSLGAAFAVVLIDQIPRMEWDDKESQLMADRVKYDGRAKILLLAIGIAFGVPLMVFKFLVGSLILLIRFLLMKRSKNE